MLENGLTLKRRPPEDCFDEKGQLKAVRGGNADAAANAMVFKGGGSRAKRGWGRLGAAERGGKSLGRMTLMMNLGQMMSGGMEAGAALGPLLALGLVAGDRRAEPKAEAGAEGEAAPL